VFSAPRSSIVGSATLVDPHLGFEADLLRDMQALTSAGERRLLGRVKIHRP
jgi:hypothetical protein